MAAKIQKQVNRNLKPLSVFIKNSGEVDMGYALTGTSDKDGEVIHEDSWLLRAAV